MAIQDRIKKLEKLTNEELEDILGYAGEFPVMDFHKKNSTPEDYRKWLVNAAANQEVQNEYITNTNLDIGEGLEFKLKVEVKTESGIVKNYLAVPETDYAKILGVQKGTLKMYRLRNQTKEKWVKLYGSIYYLIENPSN